MVLGCSFGEGWLGAGLRDGVSCDLWLGGEVKLPGCGGVGCAVGARVFGAERFWMPLGEMAWCLVVLWDGWERMVRE
jgi:hypothetical protein